MRQIQKRNEPRVWRQFREAKGAVYGIGWMPKQELREALAAEQKFICCYCMERIDPSETGMKVEHWAPQSAHPSGQIDYDNLLGACPGGDGGPADGQHCDTAKKNQSLHVHPARRGQDCTRLFRYLADGTITSDDAGAQQDIATRRLNLGKMQLRRKALLDALRSWLERDHRGRTAPAEVLKREAEKWAAVDGDGRLKPYCQVAVYWLEKKLKNPRP